MRQGISSDSLMHSHGDSNSSPPLTSRSELPNFILFAALPACTTKDLGAAWRAAARGACRKQLCWLRVLGLLGR